MKNQLSHGCSGLRFEHRDWDRENLDRIFEVWVYFWDGGFLSGWSHASCVASYAEAEFKAR